MANSANENKSLPLDSYNDKEIKRAIHAFPSLWAETLYNEAALKIDFSKRKYLIDIYNDFSPKQAILKPPQIGATTMFTLKSLYTAYFLKKDIIYTLPTDTAIHDIVSGSVNRIIAQNPELATWVKEHDSIEQKSVGNNLIRYRGTFNPKQAMMVPASLLIHDEIDSSDQEVITLYQTRQEAQEKEEDKWRWYFSHPSLAGHGVDIYWQQSDKKEWFISCPQCNHEQTLSWPESVDIQKQTYICVRCKENLPDDSRINGHWKATAEGPFSGYHVSQLMLFNKSAKDIITAYNDPQKNKQYFYNYVLGLPFVGGDDRIEPSTVLKNCTSEINDQSNRIIIGVDTGLPIHYVCANKDGVFYYDTCKDYSQLERLLNRWPKSIIVSDQGGDLIGIRVLQQRYPGRVFLCYYRKDRKSQEVITWGQSDKYGEVYVDRNNMIQLMVEQLKDLGRIRLNGTPEDWQEFADHFGHIYREVIKVNESPNKDDRTLYGTEYVWKRNGPDHYVHSLLYSLVGLSKYGESMAKIVSKATDRAPLAITTGTDRFNVILSTQQYE